MNEFAAVTLESVLVGQGFADLPASPLQLALCRAVEGRPLDDVIDADTRERHFGTRGLPSVKPTIVELVAGIRSGKSFITSCAALHAVMTAELSSLKKHEVPRFAIIAPRMDAATATFRMVVGIAESSPILRRFIAEDPTADTLTMKRPDGRSVEIVVVAASRGGITVRNRWLVGFALEEVAQFGDEGTGAVVNAEEIMAAAETRLLPGCQGWLVSSPYGPTGLLYDLYQKHFGKPGRALVVHAPTRALNPTFPQDQIDAIRATAPDVAAREYDAQWLEADTAYLSVVSLDACTRKEPLIITRELVTGVVAAMDPGTRRNSWTLAVGWPEMRSNATGTRPRAIIAGVWNWTGTKQEPLAPRGTFDSIAGILRPYGVYSIHTDSWSFDALQGHAQAAGLHLVEHPATDRELPYQALGTHLDNGDVELPPDPVLRSDLVALRKRSTSGGSKVHLPRTADGRHCDHAPSVALACMHAMKYAGVTQTRGGTTRHERALPRARTGAWR